MDFLFKNPEDLLSESEEMPLHLAQYRVAHAHCRYKKFLQGELISQVIGVEDYSIWVHHLFIEVEVLLHPYSSENVLALHYMLEGEIFYTMEGWGENIVRAGRCRLSYIPGGVFPESRFVPGKYHCVHINFHHSHLVGVAEQYPEFGPLLAKAAIGTRNGTGHLTARITAEVIAIIEGILYSDFGVGERVLFIGSRVRDLLRLYVHDQAVQQRRERLTSRQAKLFQAVESYIETHLDADLSVVGLARKFEVSRSWLQRVCQTQYNTGIHQLVRKKRMEEAARLLLNTNLSVSSIVLQVSNMNFASFSAAFLQYFRQTPLQYRKNRGRTP